MLINPEKREKLIANIDQKRAAQYGCKLIGQALQFSFILKGNMTRVLITKTHCLLDYFKNNLNAHFTIITFNKY